MTRETRNEAHLRAGGIVATSVATSVPSACTVRAAAFVHPALGQRVVVRLCDDLLAEAQILEMEVLGFERSEDRGVVGLRKSRGLGFPAWALVNDPEHARFALEVVKEFKREARRARSKPGHAKEGIDAIAARLGKSVPHFLPSFFEEAGRAFIDAGAPNQAGQLFEKAREAERVHSLAVDEGDRRRSFVEFALAGAVTIKSLSTYARELGKGHDPATAYDHFRALCVARTLGGMPPWGGMARELASLAKQAALDVNAEEMKLIDDIAEAPSLARAPVEFWKSYRAPLVARARGSAKLRGALLNLFPAPSPARDEFDGFWLTLLDECGATEGLSAPAGTVPAEAEPRGGPAAWLTRWVSHVTRSWRAQAGPPGTFALVRRMANRLCDDGQPVTLVGKWGRSLDLDLCETALELGIPLTDPTQIMSFDLATWATASGGEERGKNPLHVAADGRYAPLLEAALGVVMGTEPFETLSRERDGFREARRSWITKAVTHLAEGALPGVESALGALSKATDARTFRDFPDALEALRSVDVGSALARTIRAGAFDELGWPALEEAAAALAPEGAGRGALQFRGSFPHAILCAGTKAIVVGPKGRALEADFDVPKGATLDALHFSQGQLLVSFRMPGKSQQGFWTGRREEVFDLDFMYFYHQPTDCSVELDDGSVTYGDRALVVGDTASPKHAPLYCDGTTFYRGEWAGGEWKLREFDPRTGEGGRATLPAFFEDFIEEGKTLDLQGSALLPLPDGIASSPLGSAKGMIGWRARHREGARELETVDGRRWNGLLGQLAPIALLHWPGDDRVRPVSQSTAWNAGMSPCIWDPEGKQQVAVPSNDRPAYASGTPVVPPLPFWHCLAPRDERGSMALRACSDETARAILDTARAELGRQDLDVELDSCSKTQEVIAKRLSEVTHPRLARGILGLAVEAARLERSLEELVATRDPSTAGDRAGKRTIAITDAQFVSAFRGVLGHQYGYQNPMSAQIEAVNAFFGRDDRSIKKSTVPPSSIGWELLLGRIGAAAFLAARHGTSEADRAVLKDLLSLWSGTIFEEPEKGGKIRVLHVTMDSLPVQTSTGETAWLFELGGNDYFVKLVGYYHQMGSIQYAVLEHAPSGELRLLPGAVVADERISAPGWGRSESIGRFLERLEANGPIHVGQEDAAALAEATGLSRAEASLLWAGLQGIDEYSKNFLSKELRESLGLKVAEASAARETFVRVPAADRVALLAKSIPDDPDDLFDPVRRRGPSGHVGLLAAAWSDRFGKRVVLPQELIVAAGKDLEAPLEPSAILAAFAEPASSAVLTSEGDWFIDGSGKVGAKGLEHAADTVFTIEAAATIAVYLPYLFTERPVGDPIRQSIPDVLDLARKRLASEKLLVSLGSMYVYGPEGEKTSTAILDGIGGSPIEGIDESRDNGLVLAFRSSGAQLFFALRTAAFRDRSELDELRKLPIYRGGYFVGGRYRRGSDQLAVIERLRSPGFSAMAERVRNTPVPAGAFEVNPLHSVNDLVRDVGAAQDLTEDAAVLYLQTLALIEPAAKSVQRWNGWSAARYKKAGEALVARELLVEAKRARAGRSLFLPGPWEALKAPLPPIETWKLPLYEVVRTPEGKLDVPLVRFLPLRPIHEVFAEAWRRVSEGDRPAFEEVGR